jgi:hypothetical protein
MSVTMEKFIHTPQTPVESWDDLENTNKLDEKSHIKKHRKVWLFTTWALALALTTSLASCSSSTDYEKKSDRFIEAEKTLIKAKEKKEEANKDYEDALREYNEAKRDLKEAASRL